MARDKRVTGSGWMLFAGVMAFLSGGFNTIAGIAMLTKDEGFFNERGALYANMQALGWVVLAFGLALLATSVLLMMSSPAGRVLGIVLAMCSTLYWFVAIGAYPVWGFTALAANLTIIYGLAAHPYSHDV